MDRAKEMNRAKTATTILVFILPSSLAKTYGNTATRLYAAAICCGDQTPSMRRPVDVKAHFFFLLSFSLFPLQLSRPCRHPSIRTLCGCGGRGPYANSIVGRSGVKPCRDCAVGHDP